MTKQFERTPDFDEREQATRAKHKKPCDRCGRPLRKGFYNVAIDLATNEVLPRAVADALIAEQGQWTTEVSSMEVGPDCFRILREEFGLTRADGTKCG